MASNRKYAGLPDLDQAPDIYETPELTDDNSTHPTQSDSVTNDNEDEGNPDISNVRLDPDAARAAFFSRRVDASDADFSDRLDGTRRSYRVSSRRRRADDEEDQDTETDGEEGPSRAKIKRKIARLQREALAIKAAIEERQRNLKDGEEEEDSAFEQESLEAINDTMKEMQLISHAGMPSSAAARLALRLGKAAQVGPPLPQRPPPNSQPPATATSQSSNSDANNSAPSYTLTYQPNFSQTHALSLAASFDARLATLETALGLSSLPTAEQSPSYVPKPLLPSLDIVEKQLDIVSGTTPPFVDALSARLRQLTLDAEALEEKRRLAKMNFEEMRSSARDSYASAGGGNNGNGNGDELRSPVGLGFEDPEVASKVNALYGTLPTIESLASMLPVVVERLKGLRLLHQDAGGAKDRLDDCEERTAGMEAEIARWNRGLESVQKKLVEGEEMIGKNAAVVEKWVKELEGRIQVLKRS